jgi:hypothetical protein
MKGLGFVLVDVGADGHNEFFHVAEDATPQSSYREVTKEPLDHIQPRATGRRKVDLEAGMPYQKDAR